MKSGISAPVLRLLVVVMLIATGCDTGGGATPYETDPFSLEPSIDSTDPATAFGARQLDLLLAGETAPPSSISWDNIVAGAGLASNQKSAFCDGLGIQGADNALSSIIAAGLNALSLRLRRRPLSTDAEDILGVAVTFATATCPAWDPTTPPRATPAPILPWYPAGYQPMILHPDVAWQWAEPPFDCDDGDAAGCYGLKVATEHGCSGHLEGTIATLDANDVVLELVTDTKLDPQVLRTTLIFDWYEPATVSAWVMSISCI